MKEKDWEVDRNSKKAKHGPEGKKITFPFDWNCQIKFCGYELIKK